MKRTLINLAVVGALAVAGGSSVGGMKYLDNTANGWPLGTCGGDIVANCNTPAPFTGGWYDGQPLSQVTQTVQTEQVQKAAQEKASPTPPKVLTYQQNLCRQLQEVKPWVDWNC